MSDCPQCGAQLQPGANYCPGCGRSTGEAAAPPVQAAASDSIAAEGASVRNLARVAQTVALLAFLLPWVTVSCQGQTLASVSGANIALGRVTVHNPMTGVAETHSSSADPAVLLALLIIAGGLIMTFRAEWRKAALANLLGSAAALALIVYKVLLSGSATAATAASRRTDFDSGLARMISVDTAIGFWLACLALAAAALFFRMGQVGERRFTAGGARRAILNEGSANAARPDPTVRSNMGGDT
jgi:hypothetical protein